MTGTGGQHRPRTTNPDGSSGRTGSAKHTRASGYEGSGARKPAQGGVGKFTKRLYDEHGRKRDAGSR